MPDFQGVPPERILQFDVIKDKLESRLTACILKIDRVWPQRLSHLPDLKIFVEGIVRAAANTYDATRYLIADRPPDHRRKPEFAFVVPVLNRTILETIFWLVYIFEDVDGRWSHFKKSGWLDGTQERARYWAAHGTAPAWGEFFEQLDFIIDAMKGAAAITPEEEADHGKIAYFPNPGSIPRKCSPRDRTFVLHLNDWFYRDMSAMSHLTLVGFFKGVGQLSRPREQWEHLLPKMKSDHFIHTVILLLTLMSEVTLAIDLDEGEGLAYLWGVFMEYSEEARELYELRYAGRLDAHGAGA
jgi:hypothetical protein